MLLSNELIGRRQTKVKRMVNLTLMLFTVWDGVQLQMGSDINQVLRRRKVNKRKVDSFRRMRIKNRYQQQLQQVSQNPKPQQQSDNDHSQRQRNFYHQTFTQQDRKPVQEKSSKPVENEHEVRSQKLKLKKRQLIKKMKREKTSRGQPLMRNYIRYALTQLQLTSAKQRLEKTKKIGGKGEEGKEKKEGKTAQGQDNWNRNKYEK